MLAVFCFTMLPWFMYNYVTLGRLTLSPAGGVGRGLWEGSWQATWSGRLQNELTHLADDIDDRADARSRVEAVAAREQLPAGADAGVRASVAGHPSHLDRSPSDAERARDVTRRSRPRIPACRARQHAPGLARVISPSGSHGACSSCGPARSRFATATSMRLPPLVIRLCWADSGRSYLRSPRSAASRSGRADAWPKAVAAGDADRLCDRACTFRCFTEARQSLPATTGLLVLATAGDRRLAQHRSHRALFPVEPQVHERQHL